MDVTISIVNHNSLDTLQDCLQSVESNLCGLDAEIVVVDNLCERRAGPFLARVYPDIRVIVNDSRKGFGKNHNQVIKIAQGEYVLVLNPDVTLPPDAIPKMIEFMDANPNAAVCGPRLLDSNGTPHSSVKNPIKPLKEVVLLAIYMSNVGPEKLNKLTSFHSRIKKTPQPKVAVGIEVENNPPAAQLVPWIHGACMFFRRSDLEEIEGFDERFFLYFEETDWCLRAKTSGKLIYFLPWITAVHIGGTSTRASYIENLTIYVQSAVKFYRKHIGVRASLPIMIAVRCIAAFNMIRWSFLAKLRRETRQTLNPWIGFSIKIALDDWESK